jgi:hypothetical protein
MPISFLNSHQFESALKQLLPLRGESAIVQNGLLMLEANYKAPNRKINATDLAHAAGYSNYGTANSQYGKFAHLICDQVNYKPADQRDGSPIWTCAICIEVEKDDKGQIQWLLRPQVVTAIQRLGLFAVAENLGVDKIDDPGILVTDGKASVNVRIGQGIFREKIVKRWKGVCAVTGCDQLDLLIASHIKPWRKCTSKEKLDETNGFLLIPNLDAAFDKGYITFDDEGHLVLSQQLSDKTRKHFGISEEMRLAHISSQHREYLKFHRLHVFKKAV